MKVHMLLSCVVLRHIMRWALFKTCVSSLDRQLELLIRQMRRILFLMNSFSPLTLPFRPHDRSLFILFLSMSHTLKM